MNIYETVPLLEGKRFCLRKLRADDAQALYKVYSDEKAVPYFNGDNCDGDDFRYATLARMQEAVAFWLWSYEHGYFVRFTVTDKSADRLPIGTVELLHRDDENKVYANGGLLRIDLRSDYETETCIEEILHLLVPPAYDLFYCDKIITKIPPYAESRKRAALRAGFTPAPVPIAGKNGVTFTDYYILKKTT